MATQHSSVAAKLVTYHFGERLCSRRGIIVWGISGALMVYSLLNMISLAHRLGIQQPDLGSVAMLIFNDASIVQHGWSNLYLFWVSGLGPLAAFDTHLMLRAGSRKKWVTSLLFTLALSAVLYTGMLFLFLAVSSAPFVAFTPHWSSLIIRYQAVFAPHLLTTNWLSLPPLPSLLFSFCLLTLAWFFMGLIAVMVGLVTGRALWGFVAGWLVNYSAFFAGAVPGLQRAWYPRFMFFWSPLAQNQAPIVHFLQGMAYWGILLIITISLALNAAHWLEAPRSFTLLRRRLATTWRASFYTTKHYLTLSFAHTRWLLVIGSINILHGFLMASQATEMGRTLNVCPGTGDTFFWAYAGPSPTGIDFLPLAIWLLNLWFFVFGLSAYFAPHASAVHDLLLLRVGSRRRWIASLIGAEITAAFLFVVAVTAAGTLGILIGQGWHPQPTGFYSAAGQWEILATWSFWKTYLIVNLLLGSSYALLSCLTTLLTLWSRKFTLSALAVAFLALASWLLSWGDPNAGWTKWLPPTQAMVSYHYPFTPTSSGFTIGFSLLYILGGMVILLILMRKRAPQYEFIGEENAFE